MESWAGRFMFFIEVRNKLKMEKSILNLHWGEELIPFKTARPDSIPVLLPEHVGAYSGAYPFTFQQSIRA